jgi:hypothetical protein
MLLPLKMTFSGFSEKELYIIQCFFCALLVKVDVGIVVAQFLFKFLYLWMEP